MFVRWTQIHAEFIDSFGFQQNKTAMIQIKIDNSQINQFDEWVPDETGWLNLDSLVLPIREAGFRGIGEITVDQVRTSIAQRIKIGETEGRFRYSPRINHDQTQNEFGFVVFWRVVDEVKNPEPAAPE